MAHLVKCWCGKLYRCDIQHLTRVGICSFIEPEHERNCPDEILHGPLYITIKFSEVIIPRIRNLSYGDIKDVIEANPMKDSV